MKGPGYLGNGEKFDVAEIQSSGMEWRWEMRLETRGG